MPLFQNRIKKLSRPFAASLLVVFISSGYAGAVTDRSAAAYKKAADYYHQLGRKNKTVSRKDLEQSLEMFKAIYKKYPRSAKTPEAVFMSGELHGDLYNRYHRKADKESALTIYHMLVRSYPDSPLADDALYNSADIHLKDGKRAEALSDFRGLLRWFPKGDRAPRAKAMIEKLQSETRRAAKAAPGKPLAKSEPEGPVEPDFKRVRYWANDTYARVVFEVSKRIHYKIERDEAQNRIIVDLLGVQESGAFAQPIIPPSGLVQSIDMNSANHESSRVVIALTAKGSYSAMELSNPERIVIDINADKETAAVDSTPPVTREPAIVAKGLMAPKVGVDLNAPVINPLPLISADADDAGLAEAGLIDRPASPEPGASRQGKEVQKASLTPMPDAKIRTIVLDPGHGGKDPGAIGRGGLREKDVALDVALRLEKLLKAKFNCRVLLTRGTDIFIPLEERTAFANTNDADLFISIHANSNKKRGVGGVETYFLSPARSKDEGYVAAQENMMNMESDNEDTNDLAFILYDMQSTEKINESSRMAATVQRALVRGLRPRHRPHDHGVKQAMFYVLHGARMPSVLVETSFISNAAEEKLLGNAAYRQEIAEGIAAGVMDYRHETQMAFLAP